MNAVIKTIEDYEAVVQEYSGRSFLVVIPDELAMELVKGYSDHRDNLASNKTIAQAVIRALAVDDDHSVRWRISNRRATPPDVQIALARDSFDSARLGICCNPKVPREALEILVQDEEDWIAERAQKRLDELDSSGK